MYKGHDGLIDNLSLSGTRVNISERLINRCTQPLEFVVIIGLSHC